MRFDRDSSKWQIVLKETDFDMVPTPNSMILEISEFEFLAIIRREKSAGVFKCEIAPKRQFIIEKDESGNLDLLLIPESETHQRFYLSKDDSVILCNYRKIVHYNTI